MRVLIAGGTGRLGSLVVAKLTAQNIAVRVLTRESARAESLAELGVEIAEGDVRLPEALTAALADVDVVVSAVQGFAGQGKVSPESVDRDGNANLVAAAARVGAEFVMVSIVGASPDSPMELFRCKHAAEQVVQSSGLPWTIVRTTAFVELWAELIGLGIIFGRGDNPINFVSVNDVADLVSKAVTHQDYRGQVIEIGGPRDLTFNELAALLRETGGLRKRVRHIPRPALRLMAPLHRQPRAALVMDTANMTYRAHSDGSGQVGRTEPRDALAIHAATTARTVG